VLNSARFRTTTMVQTDIPRYCSRPLPVAIAGIADASSDVG